MAPGLAFVASVRSRSPLNRTLGERDGRPRSRASRAPGGGDTARGALSLSRPRNNFFTAPSQPRNTHCAGKAECFGVSRLGLNVPSGWWPVAPLAKGFEAAGFSWVQVHTPPAAMLRDRERAARHAAALRGSLDTCGLRLVLHAPDDLTAGTPDADRALDGLLDYAQATHAEIVVYHAANLVMADGGRAAARTRDRAAREEASLAARVPSLEAGSLTLALENLAPVWPDEPPRLCHCPHYVRDMADRLGSPRVGTCFDVGHARIAADVLSAELPALLEPVLDAVAVFHLHDNLGARLAGGTAPPAVDPLRLDLHLPPGAGRVGWNAIGGVLRAHDAPLMLEVHPPHRPEPVTLASLTQELLAGGAVAPA
jgi:sugar phosphate isomerase/epimerase